MNDLLNHRICRLRDALAGNSIGILAGKIPNGIEGFCENSKWSSYFDFLRCANGGRFGSFDVWTLEDHKSKQFLIPASETGEWLVIGQLLYEPIALKADSDSLYLFRNGPDLIELLGPFDSFFTHVVFGENYPKFVAEGEMDEWWKILEGQDWMPRN